MTPVEEYLQTVSEKYKTILEELRLKILGIIPGAEEVISYQVPCFKLNGEAVVGFAAFKNHCSLLPFSGGIISQFEAELKGYGQTKGALHFTPEHPIPDDLLKRMIQAKLLLNAKKKKK